MPGSPPPPWGNALSKSAIITVLLASLAYGIIVSDKTIMAKGDPEVWRFDWFGFREGGDMLYNLTAIREDLVDLPPEQHEARLYFLFCTTDQWTQITKNFRVGSQLCAELDNPSDPPLADCELQLNYTQPINLFHTVEKTKTYYMSLTRCDKSQGIVIDHSYTLCNRASDGSCQHLGTGFFPLPYLFLTLLFVWPIIFAVWMVNWWMHKDQNVRLQQFIAILPIVKIINVAVYYSFWERCARTGDCSSALVVRLFYSLSLTLYRCIFFTVLLLIAKGWCIMRSELAPVEKRLIALAIFFVGLTTFFTTFIGGYVLLALLMVYIGVVWFIFTSISVNAKALKAQLQLIREAGFDPTSTPAHDKMLMFQTFQTCMIVYVICDVLNFFIGSFWLNQMPWIEMCITNVLELFLFLGVCWTFRLRDFSPYFSEVPELQAGDEEAIFNGVAGENGELREWSWQSGDPLPGAPPGLVHPYRQPQPRAVVVVQNPSSRDADGNIVPNVAVGTVIVAHPTQQAKGPKGKPTLEKESTDSDIEETESTSSSNDEGDNDDDESLDDNRRRRKR